MKTYWDFTERERSAMAEEQVRALLDVELMHKGVMKVQPPQLRAIEAINVPKELLFQIEDTERTGIVFSNIDDARDFLQLRPKVIKSDWHLPSGSDKYAVQIDGSIKQVEVMTHQGVLDAQVQLKKNKEDRDHNEKVQREYAEAMKKVDDVLGGVWEDWHDQRATAEKYAKVKATLEEYKRLTEGDERLATTFLLKVYTSGEVKAAEEWFDEVWTASAAQDVAA